jgi:cytochrome c oxidase subunit 2
MGVLTVVAVTSLAACGEGTSTDPPTSAASDPAPASDLPGREVYLGKGYCGGCHTTLGAKATGPTFLGLAGSEVTLESGETVIADDAYLKRSIVDPNAQIVAGFQHDIMPDVFGETLTEQDIIDVIEYINSLGS